MRFALVVLAILAAGCAAERRRDPVLRSPDYRELPDGAPGTRTGGTDIQIAESAGPGPGAAFPEGGFDPLRVGHEFQRAGRWIGVISVEPGYEIRLWRDAWSGQVTRCHYRSGVLVLRE